MTTEAERIRVQRIRHGLIASEKAAIAEAQGGCAICRTTNPGRAGWVVAYARDLPDVLRSAADYLVDPPGVPDALSIAPSIARGTA